MPNIFDGLKQSAFDIVARSMGYDCFWGQLSEKVLLNRPTEQEQLAGNISYDPRMSVMEYRAGQFPGLFESVREHNTEYVTVNGISYVVRDIQAAFDGDTYRAQIIPQNP